VPIVNLYSFLVSKCSNLLLQTGCNNIHQQMGGSRE